MSEITVRAADPSEIPWINERYERIHFMPSELPRDFIVIAEIDGARTGIGRIVPVAPGEGELGGIFVDEAFRGRGVAAKIVSYLLENAPAHRKLYCIPFEHLSHFYQKFGFKPALPDATTAESVREKLDYCACTYPEPAVLLVRETP